MGFKKPGWLQKVWDKMKAASGLSLIFEEMSKSSKADNKNKKEM
jgi:hypothetical protein